LRLAGVACRAIRTRQILKSTLLMLQIHVIGRICVAAFGAAHTPNAAESVRNPAVFGDGRPPGGG
jgi:hypothetical protein